MANNNNNIFIKNTSNGIFYESSDFGSLKIHNFTNTFKFRFIQKLYNIYIDNVIIPLIYEDYKDICLLSDFKKYSTIHLNTFTIKSSLNTHNSSKYKIFLNNSDQNNLLLKNINSFSFKLNNIYFNIATIIFTIFKDRHRYNCVWFSLNKFLSRVFTFRYTDFKLQTEYKDRTLEDINRFINFLSNIKSNMKECNENIDSIITTLFEIKNEFELIF